MKKNKLEINRTTIQDMSERQMATIRGGSGTATSKGLACHTQECSFDVCPTDTCGPSVHPRACVTLDC